MSLCVAQRERAWLAFEGRELPDMDSFPQGLDSRHEDTNGDPTAYKAAPSLYPVLPGVGV